MKPHVPGCAAMSDEWNPPWTSDHTDEPSADGATVRFDIDEALARAILDAEATCDHDSIGTRTPAWYRFVLAVAAAFPAVAAYFSWLPWDTMRERAGDGKAPT